MTQKPLNYSKIAVSRLINTGITTGLHNTRETLANDTKKKKKIWKELIAGAFPPLNKFKYKIFFKTKKKIKNNSDGILF